MKTKFLNFFVGVFLIFSTAAHAAITFQLTTDLQSPSNTGTFEGFITFNSADVFAGNTVNATNFLDWGFTWGNDLSVSTATAGAGWYPGADSITFDSFAEITTWAICVSTPNTCNFSDHPGFYSDSNGSLNNTYPSSNSNVQQSWSRVQSVPEPASLALLGIGLAALSIARKRKA